MTVFIRVLNCIGVTLLSFIFDVRIEGEGRVAFRYCDIEGSQTDSANPNGSLNNIAGIYSEKFNVLGMMPHPENLIEHLVGGSDGLGIFESLCTSAPAAA